jgi:hypothetical protein
MFIVAAAAMSLVVGSTSAGLRVVNYNVAQMRGNAAAMADVFAALDIDEKPGFAAPVDVYVFQEVRNADVAVLFSALPANFALATYTNQSEDNFAGAQALFYRVTKLAEDVSAHQDISTGAGRRADRWKLDLVGYESPDASFYVYGMHLKAGSFGSDAAEREAGVDMIRANAAALPVESHIIYCGDMNFSSASEAGYLALTSLGPFPGQGLDMLGTGSWSGGANAIKHTQSPCEHSCLPDLIGGGMDDRFDLQIITEEMNDGEGLSVIGGSYRAFGNDGNHYNNAINDGTNAYYPADVARSNLLANDLHDASDHIPVVIDYQIPPVMNGIIAPTFGRVIEGATVDLTYIVSNDVAAVVAVCGDTLDFVAGGSNGLVGTDVGSVPALGAPFISTMAVDTSIAGEIAATVNLVSLNEGTQNGVLGLSTAGTVLRPSNPSFESGADVDMTTIAEAFDADTGIQSIQVELFNFGFDPLQALLDVDSVSAVSSPFSFTGSLPSGLGRSSVTLTFSFDTAGLSGIHEATVTIDTSDEDVTGETNDSIELTLSVEVDGGVECPSDFDGNGGVDVVDLLAMLAAWGACPGCDEDLDGNGVVDVVDLLAVLAAWGQCS